MDYSNEPHGIYFMIDSKSFYASIESVERGLNPLRSTLVVMSETDNTGTGLVLSTSPLAKKRFGIRNVSRQYEVPVNHDLLVVPPRMNLYIQKNLEVNQIFQKFVASEDCYAYSIDESILDLTKSWQLFGKTPYEVARKIQLAVKDKMGIYTTVGIGENPLQAKLALDLYAKHDRNFVGEISYESISDKIWNISDMSDVWSIGHRTEAHLQREGINTIRELAESNPYELKSEFGIIGTQLYALAWGIDRSKLSELVKPKDKSWGNSQVLPRDYLEESEIEIVIKEIGNQVASRMRHHDQMAGCVSLSIGFSYDATMKDGRGGFSHSMRIEPTDVGKELVHYLLRLFKMSWTGQTIRNIAVSYSRLTSNYGMQLDLFRNTEQQIKEDTFQKMLDKIRDRFGQNALIPASSLMKGGTMLARSELVGGHNGGNSFD